MGLFSVSEANIIYISRYDVDKQNSNYFEHG